MSNLSSALSGDTEELIPVWVEIPTGFVPLPTDDIDEHMAQAREVLDEAASPAQQSTVALVIGALTTFLHELAARNVLYCGIGHHLSVLDESVITSSLTLALQQFPEKTNPRLLLKDLLLATAESGQRGQADLVDVDHRPMLFFETERELATPQFPGQPPVAEGTTSPVYQLEALIPSADGSALVSIEFSTPFVPHGPEFRAMMVSMAASLSFTEPSTDDTPDPASSSIQGRLGQASTKTE